MATLTVEPILQDWALWPNLCESLPALAQVTPLVDGLTNSNWLLSMDENSETKSVQQYVIRINATNNLALNLNRQAEWDMHQRISQYNICPAFLYRDPSDRYWIRPFLKTATLESSLKENANTLTQALLKRIANQFQVIHNIPISKTWPSIQYSELIEHYWQQINSKQKSVNVSVEKSLLEVRAKLDLTLQDDAYDPCLCHMDPNPSNWILDIDKLHLIDWEYAAQGNRAWDLAVFSDTCRLTESQIEFFLSCYPGITVQQFNLASRQMTYLSLLWFYVQKHLTDAALLQKLLTLHDS
jgi:thiamine kinase